MVKRFLRVTKLGALLVAIAGVSAVVALGHYAYRGGDVAALKDQAAVALGERTGVLPENGIIEKGKTLVESLPGVQSVVGKGAAPAQEEAGDIEVYFAPCQRLNPFGIAHAFLGLLDSAQSSIYGAFYELELMDAATILIAKHRAGVDVRLVSDSDYRNREAMQACLQAGVPVVFDEREALMHDKFCVVDGKRVWTGSTNITENCMYRNDNNSLLITSEKLAADFTVEFREMFEGHKFGKRSPRNTPYPELMAGEVRIECYFAPEDRPQRAIIGEIDQAESSIDVMAFSFTSVEIGKALASQIAKGVQVRGLFDARQAKSEHSEDEFLAQHGARVYPDRNKYTMHNKVIIVDVKTVITGSYNFSQSAETKNDENVLIIHSSTLAAKYRRQFESLITAN